MKTLLSLAAIGFSGTTAFAHSGVHVHPHGDTSVSVVPLIAAGVILVTALVLAKIQKAKT